VQGEVVPFLIPKDFCGCGCGLFGVAKYGRLKHVRGCPCRSCTGRRTYRTGHKSQGKAAHKLGLVPDGQKARSNEEDQGGALRYENKTGSVARPVVTAFRNVRNQSEGSRPFGDNRPFLGTFEHGELHVGVFDLEKQVEVATAILLNHGWEL
jgi:hypothetical protein